MSKKEVFEEIDYGYVSPYEPELDFCDEKIKRSLDEKYGRNNYDIINYEIRVTLFVTVEVAEDSEEVKI